MEPISFTSLFVLKMAVVVKKNNLNFTNSHNVRYPLVSTALCQENLPSPSYLRPCKIGVKVRCEQCIMML